MPNPPSLRPYSPSELADQLRDLGVREGEVLLVHTSYRAVRPIEGGASGLIAGIRKAVGVEGTIIMPSWGGAELVFEVPYRILQYCTVVKDGKPVRVEYGENDHCGYRFKLVDGRLRSAGLQSEGPVGHGWARLAASRAIVTVVGSEVEVDPLIFLHPPQARCPECDLARRSIDG